MAQLAITKAVVIKAGALAVVLFGAALLFFPAIRSGSLMYLDKVELIPDLKQTDKRFAFPERGKDYCAPVVAISSFSYLCKSLGYDRLFPGADGDKALVLACGKLAELMGTKNGPGTSTEQFLLGLTEYIEKHTPYVIKSLKYQGWNRHSRKFDDGRAVPDLNWIKEGIRDNRSCWINIGWYKNSELKGELKREAGHWVNLVGYGIGLDGLADSNTLIVRDPDPFLSNEPRKIFLTLETLDSGTLTGTHFGLPRSARGYLWIKSMGNGLDSSRGRTGIIDGAIVLDLWPSWLKRPN